MEGIILKYALRYQTSIWLYHQKIQRTHDILPQGSISNLGSHKYKAGVSTTQIRHSMPDVQLSRQRIIALSCINLSVINSSDSLVASNS